MVDGDILRHCSEGNPIAQGNEYVEKLSGEGGVVLSQVLWIEFLVMENNCDFSGCSLGFL